MNFMIGIGRWEFRLSTNLVPRPVILEISDNNGEYAFSIPSLGEKGLPPHSITEITEEGNSLHITVEVAGLLAGKKMTAVLTFEDDTMSGSISMPLFGKLNLTDGHRV